MDTELTLLKECLEKRSPVLYVGAGFSIDCKNKKDESIKSANGLCELLYNHFWGDKSNDYDELAKKYKEAGDLKNLCQLLKELNLNEERDLYLTEYFSGCHVESDDARNIICTYPWEKIFTVNIDDLIENIYLKQGNQINIWNKDNDNKKHCPNHPTLIKLHGCVANPKEGYVFDDDEYKLFLNDDNYLISEFADAYSKNDIIFLGTEFNEEDLSNIITKYSMKGYDPSTVNHYYFVTPKINNELLRLKIEKSANMHHICMYANDFFTFINEQINYSNELYNKLKENGLINVHEVYSHILKSYESKLYHGYDITYGDLKNNWDISEYSKDIMDWIKKNNHNKLISIYGNEYVGKTCAAKRLLYDLFIVDYECFEFELKSEARIELFLDYITSNCSKDVAVLFEGASYLYELLVKKIVNNNPYNHRVIIITTDNTINHKKKYHSLLRNENCRIVATSEKVDEHKANLIYEKLEDKHSLSKLLDISNDKNIIVKKMKENNDIIDILYISSNGRGFEEHINTFILSDIESNRLSSKEIGLFCFLGKIGIVNVPVTLFHRCAKIIDRRFNAQIFAKKFSRIIQIQYDSYRLRYMRYLSNKYSKALTIDEIERVIISVVELYSNRFEEGEYNEYSSLLYKILNLKSLEKILPYDIIKKIYAHTEDKCCKYSYYWVQRGLCAQKQSNPDFEEADRFLREARKINPCSYQVAHAIAKNLINRGLDNIIQNEAYYQEGITQLLALLDNEKYSRAFGYSLHAFIDSSLKYCESTKTTLSEEVCILINNYVEQLNESDIKGMLSNILYRLKVYARKNRISRELKSVTSKYWTRYSLTEEDADEYLESDFII